MTNDLERRRTQKHVMTKQDTKIPTRRSEFGRVVLPEEEEIMEQIIPKDPLEIPTRYSGKIGTTPMTPREMVSFLLN